RTKGLELMSVHRIHKGAVRSLAFVPNKYEVASGGGDGSVYVTNLLEPYGTVLAAQHQAFVNKVTFDPIDEAMVTVGYDNLVIVIHLKDDRQNTYDLTNILYSRDLRFSCRGLIVRDIDGLSAERLRYLVERGAI